jgi:hypothetical protein
MSKTVSLIPKDVIIHKILFIRNEKVMLDILSEIYGVDTRSLKQAVRRNLDLFPKDFMFKLTPAEVNSLIEHQIIPSKQLLGGTSPFAFTETGVAMISSVLKSKRARETNIAIMRAFVSLRKMFVDFTDLRIEIESIKKKVSSHDQNISLVFHYLDELMEKSKKPIERRKIGYTTSKSN